jgi:hypothetical protein
MGGNEFAKGKARIFTTSSVSAPDPIDFEFRQIAEEISPYAKHLKEVSL